MVVVYGCRFRTPRALHVLLPPALVPGVLPIRPFFFIFATEDFSGFSEVLERLWPYLRLREPPRRRGRIPFEILAQAHPGIGPGVDL